MSEQQSVFMVSHRSGEHHVCTRSRTQQSSFLPFATTSPAAVDSFSRPSSHTYRVYLRDWVLRGVFAGCRHSHLSDRSQQSTLHPGSSCSHIHPPCHRASAFPPICQWNMPSNFQIFTKWIVRKQYCFVCISLMSELEQLSMRLSIISVSFSLNQTFVSLAQFFCSIIDLCRISF